MKSREIMNQFERSVWVMFVFIMNIFLIVFIFLAERSSHSQGIKVDDEIEKSIADNMEETETR